MIGSATFGMTLQRSAHVSLESIIERRALLSPCGKYRYALWRQWRYVKRFALVIGLNPSTANGLIEDATSRRVVRFAQDWGFDAVCMANLFAFRATEPKDMKAAEDPVGPANDGTLRNLAEQASMVVAAWGADGGHLGRDAEVLKSLDADVYHLGLTKDGYPRHPLYLPASTKPELWQRQAGVVGRVPTGAYSQPQ